MGRGAGERNASVACWSFALTTQPGEMPSPSLRSPRMSSHTATHEAHSHLAAAHSTSKDSIRRRGWWRSCTEARSFSRSPPWATAPAACMRSLERRGVEMALSSVEMVDASLQGCWRLASGRQKQAGDPRPTTLRRSARRCGQNSARRAREKPGRVAQAPRPRAGARQRPLHLLQ